jgi:UDPglucose 6-dehydrogenase
VKIAVVGTGYVGLVVGTCLAETGHDVICVDSDESKIDMLKRGETPIYEPGLEELVRRNAGEERLAFTTDLKEAVERSLVIFIAVGTPPDETDAADLRNVFDVARDIGRAMNGYKIVVNKSTVPVGTADKVRATIAAETREEFDVVSNPEFLKEGAAIEDFMKPDRIIIGTSDVRVAEIMKELYAPFVRTGHPIIVMDIRSAELTKYACNAMLATRISFINEIANLCERVGADVDKVRQGMGSDARIGPAFLFPGVGYGGSCFPKDVRAVVRSAADAGYDFRILRATDQVNEQQKSVLIDKVVQHFQGNVRGKLLALWGLSFKPRTDDMREAPSLTIVRGILERGASVRAYDPVAGKIASETLGDNVVVVKRNYDALQDADGLIIATEWNEFRYPDFKRMASLMKERVIFDGRNIYSAKTIREHGFTYYSIGRP